MANCGNRYLVVAWAFHGGTSRTGIWRTNIDGSNPTQLTHGSFNYDPLCSPDGKWVYYQGDPPHLLMRIRVEGGEPEAVPSSNIPRMYGTGVGKAISPDGKIFAFNAEFTTPEESQSALSKLALLDLDSNSPSAPRLIEPDRRIARSGGDFTNTLAFTPDGKSLAYVIRDQGVDNVFVQPLDGQSGHQITNFTSENIAQFGWSPDGKALAVVRTNDTSDVVLLREK
jgi:Tol biopolymer transport system component